MNQFTQNCRQNGETPSAAYCRHLLSLEKGENYNPGIYGIYQEIARLTVSDQTVSEVNFKATADYIYSRADCFDFVLPGVIFLMTKFGGSSQIPDAVKAEAKKMILDAKYWIDEGGYEKNPCYFTENHQMLFHSCEYMAGQLYPDEVFTNNGKTGRWHMEHARPLILDWLQWRFRFGFSEWLSNGYYHEDLLSTSPLALLAQDPEVRVKAQMIVDQLLFDIGMNSYKGVFGSSHGRSYCANICHDKDGCATVRVVFLENGYQEPALSPAATLLAAMDFKPAPVLISIANAEGTVEHKQRMSIKPEEAAALGVDPAKPENLFLFWGMQAFSHRLVVDNTLAISSNPGYYLKERAKAYKENFELCDKAGLHTDDDCDYTSMPQADVYTYKTDDYMVSVAQNFKKGKFGFQQHIWQVSLGGKALVFTNHPGSGEYNNRPNRWAGNKILPKAVGYKNVVICLYNTDVRLCPDFVHYTHAYFPQEFLDETVEKNGWYFGRKGDSYVALTAISGNGKWGEADKAFNPYMDITDKEKAVKPYEIAANGRSNAWICEAGCKKDDGSFEEFMASFERASVTGDIYGLTYKSPSRGKITTGWTLPLIVKGKEIRINDYPRYDCRFVKAKAGTRAMTISDGEQSLSLDFTKQLRTVK